MLHDYLAQLATALIGIIAYMAMAALHALQRRKKNLQLGTVINRSADRDRDIDIHLAELGVATGAKRAYVSSYHNGDHFIDGSEILRKSRTHEWAMYGVSYEAENFQNVLVSLMPEETKVVNKQESWTRVTDLGESRFKRLLQIGDVRAIARMQLKRNNEVIGFIGLDFDCDEKLIPNLENICSLYAYRIEEAMNRRT